MQQGGRRALTLWGRVSVRLWGAVRTSPRGVAHLRRSWGRCAYPHIAAVEAASLIGPGHVPREESRHLDSGLPSATAHASWHPTIYFSLLLIGLHQNTPFKVEKMPVKANESSIRLITRFFGVCLKYYRDTGCF